MFVNLFSYKQCCCCCIENTLHSEVKGCRAKFFCHFRHQFLESQLFVVLAFSNFF